MQMFCPKCSQQQASEEVRFCSRCGFQMEAVARLLETNGALIGFEARESDKPSLYRRAISSAGAKVIFVSIVLFVFVFILAVAADAPELMFFPFLLFVIGLAMVTYKLIFGEKPPAASEENSYAAKNLNWAERKNELPPPRSVPVSAYESPRRNTAEMRQPPPSVTEPTTKLLESEARTNDLENEL